MKALCIYEQDDSITKGKIYEVSDENKYIYEIYNDDNELVLVKKDKFILLKVEDIKQNLLPLIKLTKLLEDDVFQDDLDRLNGCVSNLTSALGYLELMKHE